mgnify:FL=1
MADENPVTGSEQPNEERLFNQITAAMKKANDAADRLEKANKEMTEQLDRKERIIAQEKLGGRADTGQEISQEEKDNAEARKLIEGTGYEDRLFPTKK